MRAVPLDYDKASLTINVSTPIEEQFRARPATKEPWTVAFIEAMRGRDALWDVGANVGSYSLIAAARGHDVVAIEPGYANFQALIANGQRNGTRGRIYALNLSLGATTQRVAFSQQAIPGYGEGGGLMLEIQQITLDELVAQDGIYLPPPTHSKIDVDGHELGVLAGAERTLREGPCKAVMIEVQRRLGRRVEDLLEGWGWTLKAVHDQRNGHPIPDIRYLELVKDRVRAGPKSAPDAATGESPSAPELLVAA